jgi:Rrf2 family protein
MRLSKKSDYALRTLFTLAREYGNGPMSIRDLAERNDVPRRFLEQIMLDLKERGVVTSVAGRGGGYVLARPASEITIGQIVRGFDGVLAPIGCCSITQYEHCSQEPICRFRRLLLEIRNYTARAMDGATLAGAMAGLPVSHAEVFSEPLLEGAGI